MKTFESSEYGIAATVTKIDAGYAVALVDTDSGETLPSRVVFARETQAVEHAKSLVK